MGAGTQTPALEPSPWKQIQRSVENTASELELLGYELNTDNLSHQLFINELVGNSNEVTDVDGTKEDARITAVIFGILMDRWNRSINPSQGRKTDRSEYAFSYTDNPPSTAQLKHFLLSSKIYQVNSRLCSVSEDVLSIGTRNFHEIPPSPPQGVWGVLSTLNHTISPARSRAHSRRLLSAFMSSPVTEVE